MKIRVKFSKVGVLKYIGHLDLMRYFQKAFRRTDIKVKYSGGFSPHMIMSFAQALGVGVESLGEYFDVEIEDGQDVSCMKDKLNAEMAEGIEVINVTVLPEKALNAMASVAASDYEITFTDGVNPITESMVEKFKEASEVLYTKKTKSGEATFNIKDYVFDVQCTKEGVFMKVDSSSAGNLKPKFLIESLLQQEDICVDDHPFHILRKELYLRTPNGDLEPLDHA